MDTDEQKRTREVNERMQKWVTTPDADDYNPLIPTFEKMRKDAERYHSIMQLLVNTRMQHGLCKPRERRACTACNAHDDIEKMVDEYKGAPVAVQVPNGEVKADAL